MRHDQPSSHDQNRHRSGGALAKAVLLTAAEWRLLAVAWATVASVRIALLLAPLRQVHRVLVAGGRLDRQGPAACNVPGWTEQAAWAVAAAGARIPGATCLPRALALQLMLARRGQCSTVHVGLVRKGNGVMKGHAWLEHDGKVLLGGGRLEQFTSLMTLAADAPGSDGHPSAWRAS